MLKAKIALGILLSTLWQSGQLWAVENEKGPNIGRISSNSTELEIARIELQGVTLFTSEKIERVLEVSPGDHLERPKVLKTEENIQELYRVHGYPEVRIQSRLVRKKSASGIFETVLEFRVQEGLPIRIAKIEVFSDAIMDASTQRSWAAIKEKIRSKLNLNFWDLLNQEKITEGRKSIQELLASESYIGAKVSEVTEIPTSQPKTKEGLALGGLASRWVNLEFHVVLGDRVSFGFQGNSVFTHVFLMNLVDEQRQLGLGKDYVGTIRTRLEDEYHAAGYALVNITPFTFEEKNGTGRKVTYYIKEGPRVTIESVEFDGNVVFTSEELRKQFFSKASGIVQHKIYVEKDVQKAAEILVDWLKEQGYLAARLVTINTLYVSKARLRKIDKSVKLLIYIYEGDQTQIQSITITGASVLTEQVIKNILRLTEGTALNLFELTDGIEQLKRVYQEKGYLSFRILNEGTDNLARYSQENRMVDITLNLEEGNLFKISRIEIEGLEKTKSFVVRRELSFQEGDILSSPQLGITERKLRRLGIFSSIALKVLDDPDLREGKIIRIQVQEADRGLISGGPGYRNDLGIRAFGQLAYTNLWGEDHTASINLAGNRRFYNYNFLEGQAQIAYVWPWFLAPELYFRPFISFGATQYVNFAAKTLTIAANWQKQLLARPNVTGEFSYSFESINQFQSIRVGDDQQMTIGSITPKISLDMRDSALIPTSGFYAVASLDYAAPFMGSRSDIGYYRFQCRTDYYFSFKKEVLLYLSFRTGYEETLEPLPGSSDSVLKLNTDSIPLIKQFALGGIGSLRGYQLQELNYQGKFTGKILSYVNYRSELDLPFAGALKLALFIDAGNLLIDTYSFGRLRFGTGFGFHYLTPVGPVSFDYGIKIDPAPGTDSSAIHFSVGII